MNEDWEGYRKEVIKVNRKLDRYEISFAMWHEEVEKLREKYGLPSLENYCDGCGDPTE